MTKEKSCGALVYRVNDGNIQMLILKHRLGGHWSFPKGHVERDETETETALREVREETGLTVTLQPGFRQQVSYSPRIGIHKDVVYFLGFAEDSRTTMQEEEISEIVWVDLDKCRGYLTYANDKQLLSRATRFLRRKGLAPSAASPGGKEAN